jgi:hypothetical protein
MLFWIKENQGLKSKFLLLHPVPNITFSIALLRAAYPEEGM